MSLRTKYSTNSKQSSSENFKSYLQSFLAWMELQNPSFATNLSDEEIANYFLHGIKLPKAIDSFIKTNSFEILSKTHQYISRYKDKTSLFTIAVPIEPIEAGNYKKG